MLTTENLYEAAENLPAEFSMAELVQFFKKTGQPAEVLDVKPAETAPLPQKSESKKASGKTSIAVARKAKRVAPVIPGLFKATDKPSDFAGGWDETDPSLEQIREKAWPKRA